MEKLLEYSSLIRYQLVYEEQGCDFGIETLAEVIVLNSYSDFINWINSWQIENSEAGLNEFTRSSAKFEGVLIYNFRTFDEIENEDSPTFILTRDIGQIAAHIRNNYEKIQSLSIYEAPTYEDASIIIGNITITSSVGIA